MTRPRLCLSTLPTLPRSVQRPAYDVAAARIGIVHLGIGAFHRAHMAVMVDDRLAAGETEWAISGVSLRSPETRDALVPQDGLYTLAVRGEETRLRVIGAVRELLVAPEQPDAVMARLTHPDTRIVSLTVTEKGYCHDPATGMLNESHPLIVADLATPERPQTAPGLIVEALRQRFAAGIGPFTVLCCDNLPANGETVRRVVTRLAALRDPALAQRIEERVTFPSTMVDRIVPATTDEDRAQVGATLGHDDRWPVMAEPFCQWVIEDDFCAGRPAFERAGAELVRDVAAHELMKLRLLNGSHSTLAYLGYLMGCETVAEAIRHPLLGPHIARLMRDEIAPTLPKPEGVDLAAYAQALVARFHNPALKHRTWQIAMDGSQKLPQRLLGTIRDRLAKDAPIPLLALSVAAWMRYVFGRDEKGGAIDVRDPLSGVFAEAAQTCGAPNEDFARRLLAIEAIFGRDLPGDARFTAPVLRWFAVLGETGAVAALELARSGGEKS